LGGPGNGLVSGQIVDGNATYLSSVTKLDSGTWTLSGVNNSYSGATTVSNGVLVIDAAGYNTGNGAITVSSGGTLLFNGANYGSGTVTVATNGTFGGIGTINSAVTYQPGAKGSFTASVSASTPMTVYGNVTLTNNSITVFADGGTPLSPGTYPLLVSGTPALFTITGSFSSAPTITGAGLAPGTRATVTTSSSQVSLVVSLNCTWINNANGNWTTGVNWDSNPSFPNTAGQVATLGVGSSLITVNLDASETVGGIAFTNSNSFVIANAANVLSLNNNTLGANVTVAAGTANSIAAGISLDDATTVNTVAGTALSISGSVSGGSALTATGNGVLTLSGANGYSGTTTLGGGTLVLGSTTAIGSGTLTITGGSLDSSVPNLVDANNNVQNWNGSFGFTGSQNLNLGSGAVTLGNSLTATINSNKLTVGGPISGAFTLTVIQGTNNNSTLELDGANQFTGFTAVSGTIALGNDSALGTAPQLQFSPAVVTPAATNLTIMSKDSTPHTITNGVSVNAFDGPYILGGTGGLTFSGTISTGNGQKRFTVNNTTIFSGFVTDNGAPSGPIIKDGTGTLVISGSNTLTKPFTLNAGTLALGSTNAIGSGALTINGGGLDSTVPNLVNANNNAQTWGGSFYFAGSQNLNLGTGSVTMSADRTITVSNNTLTVGGVISGAGALTKAGSGKLVLAGANTYTNNTTVSAGTLELVQATLATNSTVSISSSAALQLDFSVTNRVGNLILNGVSQSAGVYKLANSGGLITGTGALLVVQSGPSGPAQLTNSVSGSTLSLSWPAGQGWRLVSQTNTLSTGLNTNTAAWSDVPGVSGNSATITINPANPTVFYRLTYP
jgi:autotransporter-associated beta strand protein